MIEADVPKPEPPKRKRRWFQFSLRTRMIGVTVGTVTCAWLAHEAPFVQHRPWSR
jgi:hypothetical protein